MVETKPASLVPRIERQLAASLDHLPARDPLTEAMRYALLGPGKRVRAVLTILAGREVGAAEPVTLALGCAVEMLHAASLVFDDLPAMDAAEHRRGRAATHRVHGEALAMLAGIGLIAQAFALVGGLQELPGTTRARMVESLAGAIGAEGLCAGQAQDLAAGSHADRLETLQGIGGRKTGALFIAAAEVGALASGGPGPQLQRLKTYAAHLGLAFQIRDDLRDDGQDGDRLTAVSLLGRAGAEALLQQHIGAARAQLDTHDGPLGQLLAALFAEPRQHAGQPA